MFIEREREGEKSKFFRSTSFLALPKYHAMAFLLLLSTYITALQTRPAPLTRIERIERVTFQLVTSQSTRNNQE